MTDTAARFAFLLSHIGAHADRRFAEHIEPLGLTPPQAEVLRLVHDIEAPSQRDLAEALGVVPSRVVVLVDGLSSKGLIERGTDTADRRRHVVALTGTGNEMLEKIRKKNTVHESELCAGLTSDEQATLTALIQKIAAQQNL